MSNAPPDPSALLREAGYAPSGEVRYMMRSLRPPPPDEHRGPYDTPILQQRWDKPGSHCKWVDVPIYREANN